MTATLSPSKYQQAIYDWVRTDAGSTVVSALAGSGKTTTLLQASGQIPDRESVQLYAFNAAIAAELKGRVCSPNVRASTFHAKGFQALLSSWGMKRLEVDSDKLRKACKAWLSWPDEKLYGPFIRKLVSLAKGEGIGVLVPDTPAEWQRVIDHHDLFFDGTTSQAERIIPLAQALLRRSVALAEQDYSIDFDDQLYLPLLWDLPIAKTDWVLVDEAQDTNPVRRALAARSLAPGGRLIAVGDHHQSIYGFTGATHDAMDQIRGSFDAASHPLNVCYRCPKAVIKLAQQIVPALEAWEGAEEGEVGSFPAASCCINLDPGDAILCRNTGPLVEMAYVLIGQRTGCTILGRDIGRGLQALIRKMGQLDTVSELEKRLHAYRAREMQKYLQQEQPAKAQQVDDQTSSVLSVIDRLPEDQRTVYGLNQELDRLFSDTPSGKLTLSTIHKAKGREWPNVAILRPDLMPSKWARQPWQQEQEQNLRYVAYTRAKKGLYFLT